MAATVAVFETGRWVLALADRDRGLGYHPKLIPNKVTNRTVTVLSNLFCEVKLPVIRV